MTDTALNLRIDEIKGGEEAMTNCTWVADYNEEGVYDTSCDNRHEFIAGGIVDNNYKFCPYCGMSVRDGCVLMKNCAELEGERHGCSDDCLHLPEFRQTWQWCSKCNHRVS